MMIFTFSLVETSVHVVLSFWPSILLCLQSLRALSIAAKFRLCWHISEHAEVESPQSRLLLSHCMQPRHQHESTVQQQMQQVRQLLGNRVLGLMLWTLQTISV